MLLGKGIHLPMLAPNKDRSALEATAVVWFCIPHLCCFVLCLLDTAVCSALLCCYVLIRCGLALRSPLVLRLSSVRCSFNSSADLCFSLQYGFVLPL